MNVLFIDNFDSFTFNLVDELRRREGIVEVWRNNIAADEALAIAMSLPEPRMIVLSPGPGAPASAGCCADLVRHAAGRIPILGVCLGHQVIVETFGGTVGPAGEVVHGKSSLIEHAGESFFRGLPSPFRAGRYHSLTALAVPECLQVTAWSGALAMAVQHRDLAVAGVQFHPESILTPQGGLLFDGILEWARSTSRAEVSHDS